MSHHHITAARGGSCLIAALLASVSGAAFAADPAPAASANAVPNGDIVVTATRQSQAISKVPLSIAAYTQARMDAQGVRDINDITRLTPGLSLTPLGSGDVSGSHQTISIRGIASTVGSATTGIYIDDVPVQSRSLGNATGDVYPAIFDLERVEVLRGPQGTLFGAGAEGGVVRFISVQPSLTHYSGYMRSELSTTENGAPSYELGGALGGPIVKDVLGFRLSGWYRRDGGYIDRVDPDSGKTSRKNANSQDSYVIRGALKWAIAPNFDATASLMAQRIKQADASNYTASFSNPGAGEFAAARLLPDTSNDRFLLPSLTLNFDGKGYSVISTTSYLDRSVNRDVDYSAFISSLLLGGPYGYAEGQYSSAEIDDRQQSFSQELRIQAAPGGRFNWVAGVYYGNNRQSTYQYNYDPYYNQAAAADGGPQLPLLNGNSLFETQAASRDEQIAGFGQVDWEFLRNLKLTAGLRVAHVDLKANRLSQGPVAGGVVTSSASQSETPVTPKFGLSWQADLHTMLYASAAKGYRIGGVNGAQNSLCSAELQQIGLSSSPSSYKSDSLWSYEGGVKSSLLGGMLHLDASVFDIEWKNIQRGISLSSCGSGFITNFGSARSTGFDLALDLQPAKGITLSGSIGYADAHLTSNVFGPTGTDGSQTVYGRNGDKIGGPPLTFTLSGEYDAPLDERRKLYGRVDYQHVAQGADIDYTVYGADSLIKPSQAYDQVSLRAGIRADGIDLSAFVNNLLNQSPLLAEQRYSTAYDSFLMESTLRPRTFGVTATYRY